MDRKNELLKIIGPDNELMKQMVDEIIFIEKQLEELKQLPFISINPRNNVQQRSTPAAKQYKELLQQYTNCIKTIARISGQDEREDDSPLRAWVKARDEIVVKREDNLDSG